MKSLVPEKLQKPSPQACVFFSGSSFQCWKLGSRLVQPGVSWEAPDGKKLGDAFVEASKALRSWPWWKIVCVSWQELTAYDDERVP